MANSAQSRRIEAAISAIQRGRLDELAKHLPGPSVFELLEALVAFHQASARVPQFLFGDYERNVARDREDSLKRSFGLWVLYDTSKMWPMIQIANEAVCRSWIEHELRVYSDASDE